MGELRDYKCTCCGGSIRFDSSIQKMKCPFCDTEFAIETLVSYADELSSDKEDSMTWQEDSAQEWKEGEDENLASYICNSCGGEVVAEQTTAASFCPFCDSPVIMKGKLSGNLKPNCVIPFKLDKKAAKEGLMRHLSRKPLLPKIFKTENHIDEIKGLYVPFWLFSTNAEANMRYRASKIWTWSDNRYNYTETTYYSVSRSGTLRFENIAVDGSQKMPDELMESIEPFDISEAVDFNTAYLSGYLADKYDVDAAASVETANQRIRNSAESIMRNTVTGYNSVQKVAGNISLQDASHKYALYPVWLLNTTWRGKKYVFVMNGQTGKFAGDLPMDKGAYLRWFLGLTFGIGSFAFAALYLMWLI